jgi:hypothetical protein
VAESKRYPDLGLTVDEAIARYIRQIDDGPSCVDYLRRKGFEAWCETWWVHHRDREPHDSVEWDSRNYDAEQMRAIYDGIVEHASRTEQA